MLIGGAAGISPMVTRTEVVPVARKWHWPLQDALGDLRVRYGIKVGLAGLLALYCGEVLRLEHPNWARQAIGHAASMKLCMALMCTPKRSGAVDNLIEVL